jgi:hypothetical protein
MNYGQLSQLFAPVDLVKYLQALPKLSNTNINHIEYGILKHICKYPDTQSDRVFYGMRMELIASTKFQLCL